MVHFSCRTFREKGNTWTSTKGLLEEGTVSEKDGIGGLEGPLTGGPELVLSNFGWKSLFEKVGRVRVNIVNR